MESQKQTNTMGRKMESWVKQIGNAKQGMISILKDRMIKVGFIEKLAFEQIAKGDERINH